jgi:protein-disulfide isomerase
VTRVSSAPKSGNGLANAAGAVPGGVSYRAHRITRLKSNINSLGGRKTVLLSVRSYKVVAVTAALILPGLVTAVHGATGDIPATPGTSIVAQVGDTQITEEQLEKQSAAELAKARAGLLHARYAYYSAEREAAKKAVDQDLLAEQARAENVTVDELLKRHVKNRIKDPSEEALRIYFLNINTDQPYSVLRPKILERIHSLEEKKYGEEYIKSLRAKKKIAIVLEPPREEVAVGDTPITGPADARVTIVEFADYQCPYCRAVEPTLNQLREQYKDKIRYSYRDFPLPMHPYAEKAAEASRCAGEQGQFWPYHDRLFTGDAEGLSDAHLRSTAAELKLDADKFGKCLDSGKEQAAVAKDLDQGKSLGISGTPSFFINGYFISGAVSYDELRELVDQQLTQRITKSISDAGARDTQESNVVRVVAPAKARSTSERASCRTTSNRRDLKGNCS